MLKLGKYLHYKNKEYRLLYIGKHSDTLEDFVVYQALYNSEKFGNNAVWVKHLKDFDMNVEVDGEKVKRFKYIGE